MTREIGEIFEVDGVKLRVEERIGSAGCTGCYFNGIKDCSQYKIIKATGFCTDTATSDNVNRIFVILK